MRRILLVVAGMLIATSLATLAPTAIAGPACVGPPVGDEVACVKDLAKGQCIYGYTRDCIVYNPCNPTYCDPAWP